MCKKSLRIWQSYCQNSTLPYFLRHSVVNVMNWQNKAMLLKWRSIYPLRYHKNEFCWTTHHVTCIRPFAFVKWEFHLHFLMNIFTVYVWRKNSILATVMFFFPQQHHSILWDPSKTLSPTEAGVSLFPVQWILRGRAALFGVRVCITTWSMVLCKHRLTHYLMLMIRM